MPGVIPPWIRAADPAAHLEQGMRLGIAIGAQAAEARQQQQAMMLRQAQLQQEADAQEAALRFREVQAAKQDQEFALEQSLAQQKYDLALSDQRLAREKYDLEATEAARKHQAIQDYQSALTGGMDPNDAMLRFGPGMAANTGAAAAIRAQERLSREPVQPREITLPSGMRGVMTENRWQYEPRNFDEVGSGGPELITIPGTDIKQIRTRGAGGQWLYKNAPSSGTGGRMTEGQIRNMIDRTERELTKLEDLANSDISEDSSPPVLANGKPASARTTALWKSQKAQASKLRARIIELEDLLAGGDEVTAAPATATGAPSSKPYKVGNYTVTPL